MQKTIELDGIELEAIRVPLLQGTLILIKNTRGVLSCGYLNLETADRIGEALAIVTGVKNFDDMLQARVQKVSQAAARLGVLPGMTGQEALRLLK